MQRGTGASREPNCSSGVARNPRFKENHVQHGAILSRFLLFTTVLDYLPLLGT